MKVLLTAKSDEVTFTQGLSRLAAVKVYKSGAVCAGYRDQAAGLPVGVRLARLAQGVALVGVPFLCTVQVRSPRLY
jgi:hypothetical protein